MKKYVVLVVLNISLFLWVGTGGTGRGEEMSTPYRFTFVCPLSWDSVAQGIGDADRDLGTNTKCVGAKNLNEDVQAMQLEKAILSDVDGIITAGTNVFGAAREKIEEAVKDGIPVVLVDSDIPDSGRICYIGTDHYAAGVQAGEELIQAMEGRDASIGVIVSSMEDTNQSERVRGFQEAIGTAEGMEVVQVLECESDKMKIRKLVEEMLEENQEINALYCADEIASEMLGNTLGRAYLNIPIVTFGMSEQIYQYLQDGKYYASIVEESYQQGYQAVNYLKDYLNGRAEAVDVIYTDIQSAKEDFDFEAWRESQGDTEVVWYF